MGAKPRLGVSRCLLGERVRYDGGHKLDRFIAETLAQFVEFVPVCPEAECGLGVPREAIHLVAEKGTFIFSPQAPQAAARKRRMSPFPRLVTVATRADHTERVLAWARARVAELERECLRGFILKSKSPSCGIELVPVYDERGELLGTGAGIFARMLVERFPGLPVTDERQLGDMALREGFLERIQLAGERPIRL